MNELSTKVVKKAIEANKYGLGGYVFARISREPLLHQWTRICGVQRRGERIYGRQLSSGLWLQIYDWETR
jgi:hypothetical protein